MATRYFTVRSPSAADRAAVSSFVEGTDLSSITYIFAKVLDGVPIPVWDGSATEVPADLAPAASQSALYAPQAGPAYRAVCSKFGGELVSSFVAQSTSALPAGVLAGLLEHLLSALVAAQGGYITTLRFILANRPELLPAFTTAVRDALVEQCDAFLAQFPGKAGIN